MKTETPLFTRDPIERDQSILRFIDAYFTFMNRALARLYGMPDAVPVDAGGEFRKVTFTDPGRGGLLGQGSVLTVSANGVETSPVTRGIWLLENIMGNPPAPPPDNVPPIDPDIRGAKSMREILAKHRDNPNCFECHQKIDPLGFAPENFDPIGAWRDRYHKNLPMDSSGQLPGGESFKDLAGLKIILAGRKGQFARMPSERLLTYARGRRVEPLDRPRITRIVGQIKQGHGGFRSLIEQVVLSETFRSR